MNTTSRTSNKATRTGVANTVVEAIENEAVALEQEVAQQTASEATQEAKQKNEYGDAGTDSFGTESLVDSVAYQQDQFDYDSYLEQEALNYGSEAEITTDASTSKSNDSDQAKSIEAEENGY